VNNSLFEILSRIYFFEAIGFLLIIIVHELGHLIGGKLTGWKFYSFRVFCFVLLKENGRLRFKFSPSFLLGQCIMSPPEIKDFKFLLYNAGGGLTNFVLAGLLFIPLVLVHGAEFLLPGAGTTGSFFYDWLLFTGITSIFIGIMNLIPMVYPIVGVPNDGRNIVELLKSREAQKGFYLAFKQAYELSQGKKQREFSPITISEDTKLGNYFVANMVIMEASRLIDLGEYESALVQLSRLEQFHKKLPPYYQRLAKTVTAKAENLRITKFINEDGCFPNIQTSAQR